VARSFPELSPRGLKNLGIVLPSLAEVRIALTGGRGNAKFHALRALGSGVVLPGVLSPSVVGAHGREVQPARAAGGTAACAR
jgi:hypothetical protein